MNTDAQKIQAYWERNQLVCLLSKLYPAWLEADPFLDPIWKPDWQTIVFIQLPTGQASWHIHDSERQYFSHLEFRESNSWDGHTFHEKYERIRQINGVTNEH